MAKFPLWESLIQIKTSKTKYDAFKEFCSEKGMTIVGAIRHAVKKVFKIDI